MGPRLFRRGNRTGSSTHARASQLQWGHAFSGVEMLAELSIALGRGRLQWGHAFSGVEMLDLPILSSDRPRASMGPRLFRRGNDASGATRRVASGGFNGATPFQAWKSRPRSGSRVCPAGFNGATPFQAWKYGECQAQNVMTDRRLQWGHAFSGVEMAPLATGISTCSYVGFFERLRSGCHWSCSFHIVRFCLRFARFGYGGGCGNGFACERCRGMLA